MFCGTFVYYYLIILLTLQVVNSLLINYTIHYILAIKVVYNIIITDFKTLIIQKAIVIAKSFQLYQQAIITTIILFIKI